jgi:hypothetical protein
MAVLSGALGGSKRQKGLRAVQGVVEHARLPGEEVVVLGLADQRRTGDLIGNLGEVVLADLVDQLLGCVPLNTHSAFDIPHRCELGASARWASKCLVPRPTVPNHAQVVGDQVSPPPC